MHTRCPYRRLDTAKNTTVASPSGPDVLTLARWPVALVSKGAGRLACVLPLLASLVSGLGCPPARPPRALSLAGACCSLVQMAPNATACDYMTRTNTTGGGHIPHDGPAHRAARHAQNPALPMAVCHVGLRWRFVPDLVPSGR